MAGSCRSRHALLRRLEGEEGAHTAEVACLFIFNVPVRLRRQHYAWGALFSDLTFVSCLEAYGWLRKWLDHVGRGMPY